jgi:hypothetical protein
LSTALSTTSTNRKKDHLSACFCAFTGDLVHPRVRAGPERKLADGTKTARVEAPPFHHTLKLVHPTNKSFEILLITQRLSKGSMLRDKRVGISLSLFLAARDAKLIASESLPDPWRNVSYSFMSRNRLFQTSVTNRCGPGNRMSSLGYSDQFQDESVFRRFRQFPERETL